MKKFKYLLLIMAILLVSSSLVSQPVNAGHEKHHLPSTIHLQVQEVTDHTIQLAWDAVSNAIMYEIYLLQANQQFERIAKTQLSHYTVEGLMPEQEYTLQVLAKGRANNRLIEGATVTTGNAPTIHSFDVHPLGSDGSTVSGVVTLSAQVEDQRGIDRVEFYSAGGSYLIRSVTSPPYQVNWATDPWVPDGVQELKVIAYNTIGKSTVVDKTVVVRNQPISDIEPPTAPANFRIEAAEGTTLSVAWDASTDNIGVDSYLVYNGSTMIRSVVGTSALLQLQPGTTYELSVRAKDAANNLSPPSNVVLWTTPGSPPQPPSQKIVGYYAGWATYNGREVLDIDASKITHLNYAFANIDDNLRVAVGDPYADTEKMFPGDVPSQPLKGNFNQLQKLKQQYPHLKTIISVGGWSWSGKFSDAALTVQSREAFAESAVEFILEYGFDGVDLDWEYPVSGGMAGNTKRPEDKQNFTLLLQAIREKLDEQSALDGKEYLLTIAGAASTSYANNTELALLQQYLDYAMIMTYDIHGPWDSLTGFNAPLYQDPNSGFNAEWSVADAVQLYLQQGVPAEKIVVGVPFYGYKFDNVTGSTQGLYGSYTSSVSITYANLEPLLNDPSYTQYWHVDAMVPYLWNGSTFITYDDPVSIGYKAEYIKDQNLGGAMIWELSQDNVSRDLLQALYDGLQ